jgi:uncharacterized protein
MVSFNVFQLLLEGPGSVREFDFAEPLPDPTGELHLRGPVRGHARLTRTSAGILVHAEHAVPAGLECARCLEAARVRIRGAFDEEFFPSADVRTGAPLPLPEGDGEPLLIDDHHEIRLDEVLRQSILTNLPLQPLCRTDCPGLCTVCGERLDGAHGPHADEPGPADTPIDPASPFAQLAALLRDTDD